MVKLIHINGIKYSNAVNVHTTPLFGEVYSSEYALYRGCARQFVNWQK